MGLSGYCWVSAVRSLRPRGQAQVGAAARARGTAAGRHRVRRRRRGLAKHVPFLEKVQAAAGMVVRWLAPRCRLGRPGRRWSPWPWSAKARRRRWEVRTGGTATATRQGSRRCSR